MKIPIMSYAINLTFWLLVWLVPGEKFYGLGTGFQFQTIPVPLYVLNPMGLLWFPILSGLSRGQDYFHKLPSAFLIRFVSASPPPT